MSVSAAVSVIRRSLGAVVVGVSLAGITAACGGASAPPPAPAPAPEPALKLYVSDETGGEVAVVDPADGTMIARIPVGKRPRGLKLSPDGTRLYVALSGSPIAGPGVDESKLPPGDRSADGIGVVDLTAGKVERILPSGQDPESFDLSPDGKTLYVSNEETAEMSVVDLESGQIRSRVKVGEEPEGVTVRPDGRVVYVTCEEENEVVAVDTTSLKVLAHIKAAARPRSIVFSSDGKTAFIAGENGGAITVVDVDKHAVVSTITLPKKEGQTPPRPMGTVLSRDGKLVFASLGRAKGIAVIDVATRKFVRMFDDIGARPWGIATSPDGTEIYTANGSSNDVSIVDAATGAVKKRVTVGGSPWGVVAVARK